MSALFITVSKADGQTVFLPHCEASKALAETVSSSSLSKEVLLAAQFCGYGVIFRPGPDCTPDQSDAIVSASLGRWERLGDVAARVVSTLKIRD